MRAAFPLLALLVFGTLLWQRVSELDTRAILSALRDLSPLHLGLSLVFTALSLRAVGSYDALMHGVLGSAVPRGRARRAGTCAIALAQTLGLGTLTGALVRWRVLPELSMSAALRLSVLVSLSFLGALAMVTALVLPLSGLSPLRAGWTVPVGLCIAGSLLALALAAHRLGWLARPLQPLTVGQLLGATLLDTLCAAAALWVLWPGEIGFTPLFAAYLVALGAGLLSNAPGGVGAFDLTLLALLPGSEAEPAMAALLAFRAIYYALPACLALLALIRPRPPANLRRSADPPRPDDPPESGLARQSALLLSDGRARVLALPAPALLAIKGPAPALPLLCQHARDVGRRPVLYQCDAATAAAARRAGWRGLRLAQEARIDPQSWSDSGPAHRQLRRKLRTADKAGIILAETRDFAALAPMAVRWAKAHGGEKGLSMGRFDPAYLRYQRVFAAHLDAQPVAMVSFHVDGSCWTLDLMRHEADLPGGTMHALIAHAIATARAEGATTLSLANVLALPGTLPLARRINTRCDGLRQFKSAFGPDWQPRYLMAPTWADLALSLLSLTYAIHRPPPLPGTTPAQDEDARFSFETPALSCHSLPQQPQTVGAYPHDERPFPPA